MVDIHSRFIVGAHVHATEAGVLAVDMMKEIFGIHGVPQGTSMTSKTVAALLSDLEVTRSHSRPRVSNDNPYSEALFKTLKYGPEFPERFAAMHDARAFISGFVDWYNHHHQHSSIGFHTPANIHYGHAPGIARTTLKNARCGPWETPGPLHHQHRPQNPRAPRTRVDQPTPGGHPDDSRLTPTGTVQLEKFRHECQRADRLLPHGQETRRCAQAPPSRDNTAVDCSAAHAHRERHVLVVVQISGWGCRRHRRDLHHALGLGGPCSDFNSFDGVVLVNQNPSSCPLAGGEFSGNIPGDAVRRLLWQ